MPVKKHPDGQRSVEAEVEVPGTPEEVWAAIASGPGISAWFVPTTVDGRVGGKAVSNFGPGMESVAAITAWEPPYRFVAETDGELGPNDPPVATEWIVEAAAGGVCKVRVVHRWFASKDDWDNQFEGHTHGWNSFFRILRLYLAHFAGQPSAAFQLMGAAPEPKADAWAALLSALGVSGTIAVGQRVQTSGGAPPLAAVVERIGEEAFPEELLLRLVEPCPGLAHLFAMAMGGQVLLSIRLFLYGGQAAAGAAQAEPVWQAWMKEHFAAPGGAEACAAG